MGATVENVDKMVCNVGSAQTCKSQDPCKNGTYDNCAPSANIGPLSSSKTQIAKNWIAMEYTFWNPSKSPGICGVVTGQTKSLAVVTQGSKNLKIEGRWAARLDDPTKQNLFNSSGKVIDGNVEPSALTVEEQTKRKCTITKWVVTSDTGELGYKDKDNKIGDPNYLAVYDSETIKFVATREDVTDPDRPEAPKCEADPPHSIWRAEGTKFPLYKKPLGVPPKEGVDEVSIPASVVLESWSNPDFMDAAGKGDFKKMMEMMSSEAAIGKFATNDGDPELGQKYGVKDSMDPKAGFKGDKWGQAAGQKRIGEEFHSKWDSAAAGYDNEGPDYDKPGKLNAVKKAVQSDVKTLLYYFWWWIKKPQMEVTATACGGSRKATIVVLPEQPLIYTVDLGALASKARSAVAKRARDREKKAGRDQYNKGKELADAQKAYDEAKANHAQAASNKKFAEGVKKQAAQDGNLEDWREAGDKAFKEWANMRTYMYQYEAAAENIKQAKAALTNIQKTMTVAQKIAAVAKSPLVVRFAETFKLEIKVKYLRTEEKDSYLLPGVNYTTATMGQQWDFTFQSQPLLACQYSVYFSLLNLVVGFIPGLAWVLRKFRVLRVDLYFRIRVSLTVNGITIIKEKHDNLSLKGPSIDTDIVPRLGLIAGVGIDLVDAYFSLPIKVTFQFEKPRKLGTFCQVVPKVRIRNHYRLVFFPDRWWEVEGKSGSVRAWRYDLNQSGRTRLDLGMFPA